VWRVTTDAGDEISARFLITATGALSTAKMPDIPGVEDFKGKALHTARWDHDHDLEGERVAVIGTGATAVQLVPAIADTVGHMDVYQRTPIWVLPKNDAELGELRHVFRHVPFAQRITRALFMAAVEIPFVLTTAYNKQVPQLTRAMERIGRRWIERQVRGDTELIEKLTPRYGFGCKRPTMSNDYLRSFTREDVDLITEPIERITERGIRTRDGVEREVDTLIYATGYYTTEPGNLPTFPIAGAGGRDLNGFWMEKRFQAYEGVSVPGFPNLFLTFGPYLVPGMSILTAIENAAAHATRAIGAARRRGATRVEIRTEPHERYFALMQRRVKSTVFFNNGCANANSYYFDHHGDAPLLRPGGSLDAWWRARRYDLNDYAFSTNGVR
jgi:cation diffusion facilitator CzcD-associated flavoprotein CzcO